MGSDLCVGILAHVDAGKTTLSEALLYKTGRLKTPGRVDNKDAFLDTDKIEKSRGITVFSKQAIFPLDGKTVFLQDTPGHVDFSSEMERTLSVLDYAILVISAPDGIQPHTELLLELLEKHGIPFFVFVNKTDLLYDPPVFPENWVDFDALDYENVALLSDEAMEEYLQSGSVSDGTIRSMILEGKLVPRYSGSALKLTGIDEFLEGLDRFTLCRDYPEEFGAKCFKITHDESGQKLSWLKITGGSISVRELVGEEKLTGIRLYSGVKFEPVQTASAGMICAALGLSDTHAGKGLGFEEDFGDSMLEPVLSYRIKILDGTDDTLALKKLDVLAQEDPMLRICWDSELSEIRVSLMGQVQTEVLTGIIRDRLDMDVSIEEGLVVYKETIAEAAVGIGHFEPLRHYAEVHLLLEPLERGSGIILETACSEDLLDRNWQRLILYNLAEYSHRGVLTGSLLTDVKITLIAGRAHLKHTEGGDFRQATLRAVRQGLMSAKNVLLEPFYRFKAELPADQIGRAISDFKAMGGSFDAPENNGDTMILSGIAPVSELSTYQTEFLSYTKGKGRISFRYAGYYPCHNTAAVIEASGYDPDRDVDNSPSSVFCSHGSGVEVKWDHVAEFAHLDDGITISGSTVSTKTPKLRGGNLDFDDRQLEEIMQKEFGSIKRPVFSATVYEPEKGYRAPAGESKKEYIFVDGYNMVFAWKSLGKLAKEDIAAARDALIEILKGFVFLRGCEMVLVFDGYKLKGNAGSAEESGSLKIVFTKEGQSADAYIESLVPKIGKNYNVSVASSDGLVQLAALRSGIRRMSAGELETEVEKEKEGIEAIMKRNGAGRLSLGEIARLKGR